MAAPYIDDLSRKADFTSAHSFTFIVTVVAALIISMILIPVMVKNAARFGMMDLPDPRKVHAAPIPRVGGFGIVIGALVPIFILLPHDSTVYSYVIGSLVLFSFGVMDDCRELGHYVKFVGQFLAVIIVVYYGNVYVHYLPFMNGEHVSEAIGKPFTVFAMVGVINAINHSDGLDGLAGGESILSLLGMSWLSYQAEGLAITVIALAAIGGLLGFLRFNTYPAKIFMGDGGSQFIGFTLGFIVVLLTQKYNTALSPAIPALLIGLPLADIIAVFAQRIYQKMNWFKASRNHIHHRLLDLGFTHYQSVLIVYSVQALLVILAVILSYESDVAVACSYLGIVVFFFYALRRMEKAGVSFGGRDPQATVVAGIESGKWGKRLYALSYSMVYYGMSFCLICGAVMATEVPADLALLAVVLLIASLAISLTGKRLGVPGQRVVLYIGIVLVVYLSNLYQPKYLVGADPATYIFYALLVAGIGISVRLSEYDSFRLTTMDYLVVMVVLIIAILAGNALVSSQVLSIVLKTIIMFYGAELVTSRVRSPVNLLTISMFVSLAIISVRGLVLS